MQIRNDTLRVGTVEKKDIEKKKTRDGDKQPGTANPVAVLEENFVRLAKIIEKHPDWTLLAKPGGKFYCIDVEFAAVLTDDTAPSESLLAGNVIFDVCAHVTSSVGKSLDQRACELSA